MERKLTIGRQKEWKRRIQSLMEEADFLYNNSKPIQEWDEEEYKWLVEHLETFAFNALELHDGILDVLDHDNVLPKDWIKEHKN